MKQAFLGKKSVSNQRSLAQSDQEIASVVIQLIQAVEKWLIEGGHNCTDSSCVIPLHETSEFQFVILMTLPNVLKNYIITLKLTSQFSVDTFPQRQRSALVPNHFLF